MSMRRAFSIVVVALLVLTASIVAFIAGSVACQNRWGADDSRHVADEETERRNLVRDLAELAQELDALREYRSNSK